ncbi:MAG: translocation/assembly module TamB domain-containing protein [Fimbriimonadaceae bacterium]
MFWWLVPFALVAYRGGTYVWACVLELSGGSHAANIDLQTPGGVLKIRADHFVFDIKENRLQLAGVTVYEPDGKKLASFAEATFVDFVPGQKTVKGRVRGLRARLTRLSNGSWGFEKYMTSEAGEPSKVAFSVRLEDSAVRFEDLAAPGSKPRWISSSLVNFDGFGDEFVATATARIERAGTTKLSLHKHKGNGGLDIEGTADIDLADLSQWLKRAPEGKDIDWLRDLSAKSMQAQGPWAFSLTPKTSEFHSDVRLSMTDVVYGTYRAQSAYATGLITSQGFDGNLQATNLGTNARFSGRMRWDKTFWMSGEVRADAPNLTALPPFARSSVPKGLTFTNGEFVGWMNYDSKFAVEGKVTARQLKFQNEQLTDGRAWVNVNSDGASVNLAGATFRGGPLKGYLRLANGEISGSIQAPKLSLGPVLKSYGVPNLQGTGSVVAVLSGRASKPRIAFQADGTALSTANDALLDLGKFTVRGSWFGDSVFVERAAVEGTNGSAFAKGKVNLTSRQLSMEVLAKEFPLAAVSDEVAGAASFSGNITGKFDNPKALGRGEVYGLKISGQDLPVVIADISVENRRLRASNLVGFRRSSRVEGSAFLDFKTNAIGGEITATGIQLGEWFPDRMAGTLDVTKATIGGVLSSPTLTASISGRNLVAPGVKIDSAAGEIQYAKGAVQITQGTARSGNGVASGAGHYDMGRQTGSFDLVLSDFPLAKLLIESVRSLEVDGTVSAKGTVSVAAGAFSNLDATGRVNGLKVGTEALGSGTFSLTHSGGTWGGSAMIGQLDSFVEVAKLEASPASESLAADVTAFNIPIPKLVAISRQFGLEDEAYQYLSRLQGRFDFGGSIGGKWTNPIIESKTLTLDELKLDGVPSGKLDAKFSRNDSIWTIEKLSLEGPGDLTATGTVDERGNTSLEGSLKNVGSEWLSLLIPGIQGVPGRYDVSQIVVTGPTKSPLIQASVGFKASGTNNRSLDVDMRISDGMVEADGLYRVDGFTGGITAEIPFAYPFKIAEHEDLLATLNLPERKLTEFEELWKGLDPTRTRGAVSGELQVKGRPGNLIFSGSAKLKPDANGDVRIAQKDVDTYLTNLDVSVLFDGEHLGVDGTGRSSAGGTISAIGLKVGLVDVFGALAGGDREKFFGNIVSGSLIADKFQIAQGKGGNASTGSLSGDLRLKGTVGEPIISGDITLDSGNLTLPQLEEKPPGDPPSIDPKFNIRLRTAMPIRLRAAAGQFDVSGEGNLIGSLITPDLTSTLTVRKGSIRLPNARIAVDDGGIVKISYRSSSSGLIAARADVDIEGQTQLSAERISGGVERYDIRLKIRGNLLEEKGVVITAESDPPDLSQDRILAMLGQGDFIRGLGLGNSSITEQFRNALIGVALPYLAGSLTDRLAQQLGLDYINVEYNSLDNLSVTAALAIGKNLVLSGRRQITSAIPGEGVRYDIRLTWRPTFGGRTLRRLRFSIGTDQDRPWKIAVEYGIKF